MVVFCTLVLVFNIGLPNDLKGFLFFAQVSQNHTLGHTIKGMILSILFYRLLDLYTRMVLTNPHGYVHLSFE